MSNPPQRTIRKFNPGVFQPDREIIDQFVVRTHELNSVLEILRDNIGGPSCQHTLVIGPRGRGKTMLLARIGAELRTDPKLRQTLLPVRFMEESLEVFNIGDFWLEALLYLAKECAELDPGLCRELEATHATLARRNEASDIAGHARAAVLDTADRLGKQLVLMVENLQELCEGVDEDFGWQLRQSLQTDPEIMLLATATSRFEALDDVGAPFFELFYDLRLAPLNTAECQRLWQMVTGKHLNNRQMRPLEIFTGGSPRLLVIVAEFARHRTMPQLLEELVGLVDDHSEYFRANLGSLPKTERRVFAALADLWRPSSTGEVAERARLGVRKTSALLGRLVRRGAVTADGDGRNRLYAVGEPLHCIYYKLRRLRDEAAVVHGLIRFMVAFYGPDETEKILGGLLADRDYRKEFIGARESLGPEPSGIPACGATETYGGLVEAHQGLGDPDWQILVAGELLDIGAKLGESGEAERSIEYNDEVIRRFASVPIPEVQVPVAMALLNKAMATLNAGRDRAALIAYEEVVARFGQSASPDIQGCVATALLNAGVLHDRLGEYEAAVGSYDKVIDRFGDSRQPQNRLCVAMSLLNKGSILATPDSPESMQSAVAIWDDLIDRFGDDDKPDIKVQVAKALTKSAGEQMKMDKPLKAIAACDEIACRYSTSDRPELRRQVATALEMKAMTLNGMGRAGEALEACDLIVREYGDVAGKKGLPMRWRALGSQIHALVLGGDEPAAVRLFREMCDDLDVADRAMFSKVVWDTIGLVVYGATPDTFAAVLTETVEDCEPLEPLLAALEKLAGRQPRVPEETEKIAEDIIRAIAGEIEATRDSLSRGFGIAGFR